VRRWPRAGTAGACSTNSPFPARLATAGPALTRRGDFTPVIDEIEHPATLPPPRPPVVAAACWSTDVSDRACSAHGSIWGGGDRGCSARPRMRSDSATVSGSRQTGSSLASAPGTPRDAGVWSRADAGGSPGLSRLHSDPAHRRALALAQRAHRRVRARPSAPSTRLTGSVGRTNTSRRPAARRRDQPCPRTDDGHPEHRQAHRRTHPRHPGDIQTAARPTHTPLDTARGATRHPATPAARSGLVS